MACLVKIACLLITANNALGFERFSLNGRWTVSSSNGSITVPSTVPGGIYTDLMMAGIISEPYYGDNDLEYEWVGQENWTFYRNFEIPMHLFGYHAITLVAHGIDTACEVTLNGIDVLRTSNMFVRYEVGVKIALRRNNTIVVSCESPVLYALRKHMERNTSRPVWPTCPPPEQRGQCHVNMIRKMPCSFGWDWGPSFPSTGIWKPIELQAYNGAAIRDVTVTTTLQWTNDGVDRWAIEVGVFFTLFRHAPKKGTILISLDDILLLSSEVNFMNLKKRNILFADYSGRAKIAVDIPDTIAIERWWPTGYGSQKLYQLNVTMSVSGELCDKVIKFGFRTVELKEDAIDNDSGAEFYFIINGVPIFAKGSNWIPADIFLERVREEYVRELLQSAKDANMNMIRVWGGGIYERDYFYSLADELGILVWQDLMFSVSLYPADKAFLRSVAFEVKQQVRRLQHHPSLIVWAGSNESENDFVSEVCSNECFLIFFLLLLLSLSFNRGAMISLLDDYRKLFVYTVKAVIDREERSRPFLSSSPSNGRDGTPFLLNISDPGQLHPNVKDIWAQGSPNSETRGDGERGILRYLFFALLLSWPSLLSRVACCACKHRTHALPRSCVCVSACECISACLQFYLDQKFVIMLPRPKRGLLRPVRALAVSFHYKFSFSLSLSGKVHFYEYWQNGWDPSVYPIPRFVSEFGLPSYPSAETMQRVSPDSTLVFPFSPFINARQRHNGGTTAFSYSNVSKRCGLRNELIMNGTEEGYIMVSYLSQIVQAEGVRTGCESFRRWRSYLDKDGRGHTMGVLFWQLNDIWQAPSWSSIEYGGRWKMLHYFAKKFFSPVIVSPFIDGSDLRVFVVNDRLLPLQDVSLRIIVQQWTSFIPSHLMRFRLTVPAASSLDAVEIELEYLWNTSWCSNVECFLWFTLEDPSTKSPLAPEAYVLPVQPGDALLRQATITVSSVTGPFSSYLEPSVYTYNVELLTDNVALFVWLDSQALSGRFSDNGFLLKDPAKVVQFRTSDSVTPEQLQGAIVIYSVSDCTVKPECPRGVPRNGTLADP
ncbi:beta-mannosidase-like [Dermacentor andersoni]|uniref:beta-mannosidase-like n=1 Tax=Dermacentor andersoni TaxID=34620 RepID=UPI003B3B0A26